MDIRCKRCPCFEKWQMKICITGYSERLTRFLLNFGAQKGEYDARLELCKECEKLIGGMCRVCGCFVEVRAAKKSVHCPGIPRRWDGLQL